ncbi:MAG: hypothetical protein LBQ84_07025 [Flavobacteriaceae bacterium]|jgi:hypothetical protein|nr:hypothetical protein [Flavobacteriaceae bacterium]
MDKAILTFIFLMKIIRREIRKTLRIKDLYAENFTYSYKISQECKKLSDKKQIKYNPKFHILNFQFTDYLTKPKDHE